MNKSNLIPLLAVLFFATPSFADVDTEAPRVVHEPCEEYETGKPFQIWARFYDDSPIFDPTVHYRFVSSSKRRSKAPWLSQPFTKDEATQSFFAKLDTTKQKSQLEYFIEVFDENGNGPALFGTVTAPIVLKAAPEAANCIQIPETSSGIITTDSSPEQSSSNNSNSMTTAGTLTQPPPPPPSGACEQKDPPFYCSPIVWIGIGAAVVAAAGVGTYFLLAEDPAQPPKNEPVSLVLSAPDPSQSLELGPKR